MASLRKTRGLFGVYLSLVGTPSTAVNLHRYGPRRIMSTSISERVLGTKTEWNPTDKNIPVVTDPKVKVSKAMRAYLERAQAHSMFMKQQSHEFEIGRRHLANMMGEDPETFTQDDINQAIEYLLPSNLFSRKSRPVMRPPEEIFPQQKEAQFSLDGRPFHPFFYTAFPNYFQTMHDIVQWTEQLNGLEDDRVRRGKTPPDKTLPLTGTTWLSAEDFAKILVEPMYEHRYRRFILSLERLVSHPYAYRAEEFVMKFRKTMVAETIDIRPPELKEDEAGRQYAEGYGTKKSAHAWVTLKEGTGRIDINGQDILYFPRFQNRQQVMFPLHILDKLFKYDLTAQVRFAEQGGSAQAGAIREATTKCLTAFVTKDEVEVLRQAGLLTHDLRVKERKKYAFRGARAKPIWRKR